MKLEGSLDTFPLRELVDMIVYSSVTGVLNIYAPGEIGHLYFRESVLYHVECRGSRGLDGLAELLELRGASFSFVSDLVCDEESLHGAVVTHLRAAELIAARWRTIRAYVPSLEQIPHIVGPREAALRRASPIYGEVLEAIDGRASMRQIAGRLGWAPIDAAEATAQLSVDGLVELRSPRPIAPRPEADVEPAAHRCEGLFDRILAHTPHAPAAERPRPTEPPHLSGDELILRVLRS